MSAAGAPIRVLIADDERAARLHLRRLLEAEPDVVVVGEACHGRDAVRQIAELAPALLFLDVEMPELDGLAVVAAIGPARMPATVFATAHERFALPAFQANALDYLLKPFDDERFGRALAKARRWLGGMAAAPSPAATAPPERLLLRVGESQQFVRQQDIRYVTAARNYVHLHLADGPLSVRESLQAMAERLDPSRFRRIHRSHIVNLDHVSKILPWFGGDSLVLMSDGCRLNLSRNYRHAIREYC